MNASAILSRHPVPNLFDANQYYQLNVRTGVMRTSFGTKCCTLSGYALKGLYEGLKHEAGPAWHLIMRRCGESWGKRFAQRFLDEVATFYQEDLEQMNIARFTALLEEYFAVSGWGRVRLDYSQIASGLLIVDVQNEIFGDLLRDQGERTGALLEGVLKTLLSAITGNDMDCYETQSMGKGAPISRFLISSRLRLSPVQTWRDDQIPHDEIVSRLLAT
ncbi:hypothetical protein C2W62_32570 [Candidatus Entotheonella serta]|nr:hypothetical protein C2W62_32570 [Candidatus Entotheonella serta]